VLQRRRWTPIPLFFLAAPVLLKIDVYAPAEFLLLIVVFVFVAAGNDFFGLLSSPAVFLLGTVSYSFYIVHGIVLFALSHLLNRWVQIRTLSPLHYWSFIGVVGVIAICFATLLYWTVERRFMKPSSALSRTSTAEQQVSETQGSMIGLNGVLHKLSKSVSTVYEAWEVLDADVLQHRQLLCSMASVPTQV
jgi:peptidoglycan/LPS O-acetylase OafA/YrhL